MSNYINYEDFVKTYSKKYQSAIYYPKILEEYKSNKDIDKISKSFKIPYQTIWKWVNNKTIPIPFVGYSKIKKEFSEKDIQNLAPVVGCVYGDGGITNKGRMHYCNSEDFLINYFVTCMGRIFLEKPQIKKEINITRIKYSPNIGKSLWCIFGKFSFGKDTKMITQQIQRMPLEWKAKMLQAWFNDDGSVPKYGVVSIKQKLKPLIIFIQETLLNLGIKSILTEDNKQWLLRVCGYDNLVKFKEKINFSEEYRKREKLNELIASIKHPHFETKNKILELLKKSSKTRDEIARLLSMNKGVIYGHLHGLKRKNRKSNRGLVDLGLVKVKRKGRINIYLLTSTPSPGFGGSTSSGSNSAAQC